MSRKWRAALCILLAGSLAGCGANTGTSTGVSTGTDTVAAGSISTDTGTDADNDSNADSSTESSGEETVTDTSTESAGNEETAATQLNTEEGKYPIHWDLTDLYADTDAWQADYDKAAAMLDEYDSFVGKINNVDDIYAYMEFSYGGELNETESRLMTYAELGSSLDGSDDVYATLSNKIELLLSQESMKNTFFQEELLAIPYEERVEILSDPLLEEYSRILKPYMDPDVEALSEETVIVEETLEQAYDAGWTMMESMLYLDVADPEITLPDGTTVEMNDSTYFQIVSDSTIDRETKKEAKRLRMSKMEPYLNTAASALETTLKENWSLAQLGNADTTRAYFMDQENVDAEVYDLMIDSVHEMLPDYQRYLNLHAAALGLEEQYSYDLYTNVSDYARNLTDYDDAVDEVRDALAIYGEDYVSVYDAIMESGHVDVYPSNGKTTGAFMMNSATTTLPYVLFNYGGSINDVSTIAHEMGHALYSALAQSNQEVENRQPETFTQEVASTLNELIFYNTEIKNAGTTEEKLYYLENEIRLLNNLLLEQAQFAEFEDAAYQLVESGESLSADRLNAMWQEINDTYAGDGVTSPEEEQYFWAQLPQLHYGYYNYQYATSISYAASIYAGFEENGEESIEAYKEFLKAGNSDEPRELLLIAGIDIEDEETYERTKEFYADLIDQYEALLQETEP